MSKTTPHTKKLCPKCGHVLDNGAMICPLCTTEMIAITPTTTLKLDRMPMIVPKSQSQTVTLAPNTRIMFQVLPSGACLALHVDQPTLLGRYDDTLPDSSYPQIDLAEFSARQHGVSRRHCLLKRHESRLTISDLGSTNGTYLNGNRLPAFTDTLLADGDKVILGTLHLALFFTPDDL